MDEHPLHQPEGRPMRFAIDLRQCQDHGHCAFTSSAFDLDGRGRLAVRKPGLQQFVSEPLPASLRDEIEEAVFACPAQAIDLLDDDA
ncbi:hypothetical protein CF8_4062 [Nocardioides sp. CF8]|nr:hypothetical protein CF8_4062 [Nocardioides sp. CF8]